MRTQDEILVRATMNRPDDFFGFGNEVLVGALDYEHAKPLLKPEVTAEEWEQSYTLRDDESTEAAGRDYMIFAWGKVIDHRGISASRSVSKITEYAWLLGRDDVVTAMEEADYAQYGAPKLAAACKLLRWPIPEDPAVGRMIEGLPCVPDCMDGCGA